MSSQAAGRAGSTEQAIGALDGALVAVEALSRASGDPQRRAALKRAYMEIESSVFLLKMAAREDGAPPYDAKLEKLGKEELASRMTTSLGAAQRLAGTDLPRALAEARVARDCAATALHAANLEFRRNR